MDTLGALASAVALLVHVGSHPRALRALSVEIDDRPAGALVAALVLSIAGIAGGAAGYHRDWPRWANGRAIFAVGAGSLVILAAAAGLVGTR